MGTEKAGAKGSGFFHLFDWNRKSRKKLFANGAVSPEGANQGKNIDNNMPTTHLCLVDGDEIAGVSSNKGSSEYSCASSVTDEDGNGIRAPGVVARLMGLDSLPTSGASEPYSTPLFDSQSLRERRYQKRNPEFHVINQCNAAPCRADGYSRKPTESRSQKMPSSPIERFQREMLPPKSAKSLPVTHYKLLSPIKNPRFISAENAAHIMEAAAKIIEPGLQTNSNSRVLLLGPSSLPLKVHDSLGSMATSQRTSRFQESSSRPVESDAVKYLRGQPLTKSWIGPEDNTNASVPPNCDETDSIGTKGKGKSISLAIQAKVNVQRREGLGTSSRSTLLQTNQDQFQRNQLLKNQTNAQTNKSQKRASTVSSSTVLKQNNQKQNCLMNRDKLLSKPSIPNQQGRKVLPGDISSGKQKTSSNKLSGHSKVGYRKEDMQSTDPENEGSSSKTRILSRKKRLISGELDSDKCGFTDSIVTGRHEKRAQPNVVIDEHLKWGEDSRRNGMDVVSFTFTSPMRKTMPESQSSTKTMEKQDKKDDYYLNTPLERNATDMKKKKFSSLGLNMLSGDALSSLLEQKLRELTSGFEPSYCNVKAGTASVSGLLVSESALGTLSSSAEHYKEFPPGSDQNNLGSMSESISSITTDQVSHISHKLQGVEYVECSSSSSDAHKRPSPQHPSPLSILEASFSNESCCSSESYTSSSNGTKMWSSAQAQNTSGLNCINKVIPLVKAEVELSDSASSSVMDTVDSEHAAEVSTTGCTGTYGWEVDYVREIMQNTDVNIKDLALGHAGKILDPLLFELLENKKSTFRTENGERACNERRKVLFDCVRECLNVKCSCYFQAGYRKWAKGVALVRREEFAEEIYTEISGLRSMEDWMVDELVDKDMSSHLGRWVDYENEAFEIGGEIERGVLSCLINEVVSDFLV